MEPFEHAQRGKVRDLGYGDEGHRSGVVPVVARAGGPLDVVGDALPLEPAFVAHQHRAAAVPALGRAGGAAGAGRRGDGGSREKVHAGNIRPGQHVEMGGALGPESLPGGGGNKGGGGSKGGKRGKGGGGDAPLVAP